MDEAEKLIKNGTKELTLLGQNVNAYFYKDVDKNYRLSDLILELDKITELKELEVYNITSQRYD